MGYSDSPGQSALAAFEADYQSKTELNRKILDHLLHDAFSDDAKTEPESDLVLDPEPAPERIAEVLGTYRFRRRAAGLQEPDGAGRPKRSAFFRRAAAGIFWPRSPRSCCKPSPPRPTPTSR